MTNMRSLGVLCALFAGCALAPGSGPASSPPWETIKTTPLATSEALVSRGRELFASYCASCHGRNGDGAGTAAELLQTSPSDLTEGVFKLRTTPDGTMPQDLDLFRTLATGIPVSAMPSFRYLAERDRWAIVHFLKTLSTRWQTVPVGAPLAEDRLSETASADLTSGRALYLSMGCPSCHGGPERDGPPAKRLADDNGHIAFAPDFRKGPLVFKGGGRTRDIKRVLLIGVPGTRMRSYEDRLPQQTKVDSLASFVHSLSTQKRVP